MRFERTFRAGRLHLHNGLPIRRRWRRLLLISLLTLGAVLATLTAVRAYSAWQGRNRVYTINNIPERPVAIVFGAQIYASGRLSAMLTDRVKTAAELYRAGKVKALLFTGDNHVQTYNEPESMRRYATSLGVPDRAIVLDYAGFRTYDSCYRARDIFKVNEAILVTQSFHLDRALLICNSLGIDSVGIAADGVRPEGYSAGTLLYSQLREFPATMVSVLDLLRGKRPTFLGESLPIVAESP